MTTSLVVLIALMAVSIVLGALLKEPKIFITESDKAQIKPVPVEGIVK
jgi:hypothetical protein